MEFLCSFLSHLAVASLASHADVLRGTLHFPGGGMHDEPLRTSAWEAIASPHVGSFLRLKFH